MFGQVTYISRAEYADRQSMFDKHVERVVGAAGPASKVLCMGPVLSDMSSYMGSGGFRVTSQMQPANRLETCSFSN